MKVVIKYAVKAVAGFFGDIWREIKMGAKIDELRDEIKVLIEESNLLPKKPEPKKTNPFVIVLAVIGAIATVAAIAYAVYYFLIPVDSEDFEDFDDYEDFEDDLAESDLEGDE